MATVSGFLYLISGIVGDVLGYYRYLAMICGGCHFVFMANIPWKNNAR